MSLAVQTKECMFFVGGNSAKSTNPAGYSLAGGCTKSWWNSQPNIDTVAGKKTAMGKLMTSSGEPICYDMCFHSDNGSGKTRFTSSGSFTDVEAGMLLFCEPTDTASGAGTYEVIAVDASGNWLDIDYPYSQVTAEEDVELYIGGAWSELSTLAANYVDASDYPQEVWVNKNLAPTIQWDLSNWSGLVRTNSWMKITGFHRVPGDITDRQGAYYQTVKDMFDNGVDPDFLVGVDYSGMGTTSLFDTAASENVIISGFNFYTSVSSGVMFPSGGSTYYNLEFSHNAFKINSTWKLTGGMELLFYDNLIARNVLEICSPLFMLNGLKASFLNNYFKDIDQIGEAVYTTTLRFQNNIFDIVQSCSDWIIQAEMDGRVHSCNNTYIGFNGDDGVLATAETDSHVSSVNDLFYNRIKTSPAFHCGFLGGSFIVKNSCAYAENGKLDEVMTLDPTSPFTTHKNEMVDLLEVDPLIDSGFRPRNKKVLLGGTEVGGQKTTIGAISQEHQFVGRSLKSNPGRLGIFK